MNCTICVAKIKALISFAVTVKLICVFVFANAKRWISHDVAHVCCKQPTNVITKEFFKRVLPQKDSDGIANSVDNDQTVLHYLPRT